jgi:hypothetical protein
MLALQSWNLFMPGKLLNVPAGCHPLNAPFGGLSDKSSTAAMTGRTL